jgi:hypothetical protein
MGPNGLGEAATSCCKPAMAEGSKEVPALGDHECPLPCTRVFSISNGEVAVTAMPRATIPAQTSPQAP